MALVSCAIFIEWKKFGPVTVMIVSIEAIYTLIIKVDPESSDLWMPSLLCRSIREMILEVSQSHITTDQPGSPTNVSKWCFSFRGEKAAWRNS
jgi:hypothetical protein